MIKLKVEIFLQCAVELHIVEFIDLYGHNLSLVAAGLKRALAGEECSLIYSPCRPSLHCSDVTQCSSTGVAMLVLVLLWRAVAAQSGLQLQGDTSQQAVSQQRDTLDRRTEREWRRPATYLVTLQQQLGWLVYY